jgi:hypothetical protein
LNGKRRHTAAAPDSLPTSAYEQIVQAVMAACTEGEQRSLDLQRGKSDRQIQIQFFLNVVVQGEMVVGDKIEIGNVTNSAINVKSKLEHVSQTISAAPLEGSKKAELEALVQQLKDVLETAQAEKPEAVEAVSDALETTMSRVGKPQPNKKSVEGSMKNLADTAEDIAEAIPIVTKIGTAIASIFGFTP